MIFFKQLIKIFSRFIILYGFEGGSSEVEKKQTQENNDSGDVLEGNEKISIIPENIEEKLEKAGLTTEDKEKFENFLIDNPDLVGELIKTLEKAKSGKLKHYIKKNGIVVNEITYQAFAKKFNINLLKELIDKNEESIENKKESIENKKESFNKFLELGEQNIISDEGFRELFKEGKLLKEKLSNNDSNKEIENFQEKVIAYLSKVGVTQQIAQELYDSGDIKSYDSFKTFALGLNDPIINLEIEKFDESLKPTKEKDPVVEAMTMSGLIDTSNVERNGSILSSKFDGKEIMIDTGDIPPSRYMSLEGSDYNMETELPIGNFYKAIANEGLEYEKAVKNMNSTLGVMDLVGKMKIEDEDYKKESFNTIVISISKNTGVDLSELKNILNDTGITSKEGLKFYIENKGFSKLENKLEQEVEGKKKAYQNALKQQIQQYKSMLEQQDKKTEETLKKLHETCFDLFPQETTDQLIKEYKTTAMVIPLPGGRTFIKETMDLENGRFGEPLTVEAGGDIMIDNIVMFMEKAIYGEIGSENSIFKNKNFKTGATIEPIAFNKSAEENGILSEGTWNIQILRDNLSKEIKSEEVESQEVKNEKVEGSDWYSE